MLDLKQGDCLEVMKEIADHTVDCILRFLKKELRKMR